MGTYSEYDIARIEQEYKTYRIFWTGMAMVCMSGIVGLTYRYTPRTTIATTRPAPNEEQVHKTALIAEADQRIQDAKNVLYNVVDRRDSEAGAETIMRCADTLRRAYQVRRILMIGDAEKVSALQCVFSDVCGCVNCTKIRESGVDTLAAKK